MTPEEIMIQYLLLKVEQKDWHGVSDAANDLREMYAAIIPIKEALAQPEQEPVGYLSEGGAERLLTKKQAHEHIKNFRLFTHDVPLYTAPPQPKEKDNDGRC